MVEVDDPQLTLVDARTKNHLVEHHTVDALDLQTHRNPAVLTQQPEGQVVALQVSAVSQHRGAKRLNRRSATKLGFRAAQGPCGTQSVMTSATCMTL